MSDSQVSRRTVLARSGAVLGGAAVASLPGYVLFTPSASAAPRVSSYGKTPRGEEIQLAYQRVEKQHGRVLAGRTSLNRWGVEKVVDGGGSIWTRPVPGTPVEGVAVRIGAVEAVLVHVVQRFHYDVERLTADGVVGWRPPANLNLRWPEGNQASGTAVRIRPDLYPAGTRNAFFYPQLAAIRAILAESGGVVRWGGDDAVVDESLFYIAVGPADQRLTALAQKLRP